MGYEYDEDIDEGEDYSEESEYVESDNAVDEKCLEFDEEDLEFSEEDFELADEELDLQEEDYEYRDDILENQDEGTESNEEETETDDCKKEDIDSETEELKDHYRELGIDEATIEQLFSSPDQRTWRGLENIDALRHPQYLTQKTYVATEEGGFREAEYGEKGSQRPDAIAFMEDGICIREDKNYHNADALIRNIEQQAHARHELFGDALKDLTFVVSPTFTIEEMNRITEACERCGANIEYVYH